MGSFAAHNAMVRRLLGDYARGAHARAPVTFSLNARMVLLDPALNPAGVTPRRFFEDPAAMWDIELAFRRWLRFDVPQDAEMGLPEVWEPAIDFFNCYEAGWFGCELWYPHEEIADTRPMFADSKEALYDTALPDPLHGNLMGRVGEFLEYFEARRARETYLDRPIARPWLPTSTDGPLTVACNLRGATEVLTDLIEDETYFHDLMAWVTDGIARRMRAWKKVAAESEPGPEDIWWFADDAIGMLSPERYRAAVLPYHLKLVREFRGRGMMRMHLCGRAQHLFSTLVEELGVDGFEVGFPTDLARARFTLGEDIELLGNVHPDLLRSGPTEAIDRAVRAVCQSGALNGGRLIVRDGNNCAPRTPIEHFQAMYEAGQHWGKLA